MNKQSKPIQKPPQKENNKSKVSPTEPSRKSDKKPLSESDNSVNLFEENIEQLSKDEEDKKC